MKITWPIVLVALAALSTATCASPDVSGDRPPANRAETPRTSAAAGLGEPVASTGSTPRSGTARPRIVFLGDSLTAGLGLSREDSVTALLQRRLDAAGYGYDVINAGVSGDTSAGGLSRLDWSLDGDVRVLVLELGANDGLRGNPVAGMRGNLDEIIRRAKQRKIQVLLTGMEAPPNFGQAYTADFRAVFADLARQHDVAFMPFFLGGVAGLPALNGPDGIHPNPAGAKVIEAALWPTLEPLLEKQGG